MSTQRFTSEFKAEAVRQVIERGYSVAETAERLGVSTHSLYKRVKSVTPDKTEKQDSELLEAKNEILRLRAQMRRLEEERDILKKSSAVLRQGTRVKYRFMNEHRHQYAITTLCRVLQVARAGFYHWLHKPVSDREKENSRLLGLIRDSYAASRGVYGARRVFADLREAGESCGKHRVAGLMRTYKIKALRGYKAPRAIKGRPSIIAPNRLNRVFTVDTPNKAWVTDITHIRTWQGWLYLAVVLDLYARQVVGWSMKPTLGKELALDALIMAVWRRKPKTRVIVHSDQGAQYGSDDWKRFCLANHL